MKVLVGLGNTGEKYLNTRHNLGFALVDEYAQKHQGPEFSWNEDKKVQAQVLKIDDVWLIKPQTMMNASGLAVKALMNYYKVDIKDLVIVHDDLDLLLGKIKIKTEGSAGGHRGVGSIINELNTDKFIRIKLGIGNQKSHAGEHKRISFDADKFVVEKFTQGEKSKVRHMLKQGLKAVEAILNENLDKAQTQFN